jgi:hypothetical protein
MCAFQKDKQWMKISSGKFKKKKSENSFSQQADDNYVCTWTYFKGNFYCKLNLDGG